MTGPNVSSVMTPMPGRTSWKTVGLNQYPRSKAAPSGRPPPVSSSAPSSIASATAASVLASWAALTSGPEVHVARGIADRERAHGARRTAR